jgi:phospholipid/cholesterol/gamma-HCH transport system substrate-binding protein
MSTSNRYTLRLGIFVVIALTLFILASYFIGNNENLFTPTFKVSARFGNVNGLQPGNNVHYAGIKVGTVSDIAFENDSTLRVDMVLEKKVLPYMHKDAVASIGTDGLVGNMLVNISPGSKDAPPISNGDVLNSYSRIKTEEIINTFGKTNENLAVLANDLLEIAEKVNSGKGTIGMLLRDTVMAQSLQQTVSRLNRTAAYLQSTSRSLEQIVDDASAGQGLVGLLTRDTVIRDRLHHVVARLDTGMMPQVNHILDDLERSGQNIESFSGELDQFSQELRNQRGVVGTMLYDTASARDIRHIIDQVDTSTLLLNENLKAMREHFLFRRYFRKKEKEERKKNKNKNK